MKSYRDHLDDYSRLNYRRGNGGGRYVSGRAGTADRRRGNDPRGYAYAAGTVRGAYKTARGYKSGDKYISNSGIKALVSSHSLAVRAVSAALVFALLLTAVAGAAWGVMLMSFPRRYRELVSENCQRFGVDESFVYAVIRTESGFDPEAHSSVGALGLMQIMPDTYRWLRTKLPDGEEDGTYPGDAEYSDEQMLLDPEVNIRYGVFLLSVLRSEFGSDTLAAAAYHAGMGKVREWVSSGTLAAGSHYEDIPSDVTSHYVYKVETARRVYSGLYYSGFIEGAGSSKLKTEDLRLKNE